MADHSLRFDNPELQEHLISELRRLEIKFVLGEERAVECENADWNAVNNVAHIIRDKHFRGFFTWFPAAEMARQFLVLVQSSELPFLLHRHNGTDVFFLPKAHQPKFEELGWQVYDSNRTVQELDED